MYLCPIKSVSIYIEYKREICIIFFYQGSKIKPKEIKKPAAPNAREVEMQNWKRRKSYDPMKAAMEGKKKTGLAKKSTNANLSPR